MQHLEEQIAHLTKSVEELSDIVAKQQKDLDLARTRLQILMEREAQREAEGSGGVLLGDERPPHY